MALPPCFTALACALAVVMSACRGSTPAAVPESRPVLSREKPTLVAPPMPPLRFTVNADGSKTVDLTGDVYFALDSAELTDAARVELAKLAPDLFTHPGGIVVSGRTDGLGTPEHNLDLSTARAWSVARFLDTAMGIDPARIRTVGLGEEGAPDNTPAPHLRRVTIRLDAHA